MAIKPTNIRIWNIGSGPAGAVFAYALEIISTSSSEVLKVA